MTNENKLLADFKAKWIEALRSGKYGQGKGKLTDGKGNYCCLGIACIVGGYQDNDLLSAQGGGYAQWITNSETVDARLIKDLPNIPKMLHGWSYNNNQIVATLQKMNDLEDKSFNEIAQYIEENL